MNKNTKFWNSMYWVFFSTYILSFFLPAAYSVGWNEGGGNDGNLAEFSGGRCAISSIFLIFHPVGFLGNFANFSIIFWWFSRQLILNPRRDFFGINVAFFILAVVGSLVWPFFVSSVLIGYFIWVLSVWGMGVANIKYRLELAKAAKETDNNDISQHLISKE